MSDTRIPIVLCIDVEPDDAFIDRRQQLPWRGFEQGVLFAREVRQRLERVTGQAARFNWFVRADPQVADTYGAPDWAFRHYQSAFSELGNAGDEIGFHSHAFRWSDQLDGWLIDQADERWIEHTIRMGFDAASAALGRPCTSFRYGDRWLSNQAIRLLDALGVQYELTLEPGHRGRESVRPGAQTTGAAPDHSDAPTGPYRPSLDDYRMADVRRHSGLWMLPITTAAVRPSAWRDAYYWLRQPHIDRRMWTAMLSHDPVLFRRIMDNALGRTADVYLAATVRTNVFGTERLLRRVKTNLATLLDHPRAGRFVFATPQEAVASLRPER